MTAATATAPATLRPLREMEPETRRRIESAVLDIFSQREFHKVSLIEIATAANVSLQTIYKYYGSKEALLFNSLDTWLGQLASRMIDHLQGIETYQDRLRKVFWLALDFFDKNPKVAQLIMSSVYLNTWQKEPTFQQPALFGLFLKVLGEGKAKGVLSDEVEEKILLDFIIGITSRMVFMWITRGEHERHRLTDQANVWFEMLWRAIA
ncbi:MAG: TetR/AcrR family transcriptional regulator, partial [Nevskiales bacterium]